MLPATETAKGCFCNWNHVFFVYIIYKKRKGNNFPTVRAGKAAQTRTYPDKRIGNRMRFPMIFPFERFGRQGSRVMKTCIQLSVV